MTITDKVQLIKEKIERLQRNLNECISPNNPILPGTLNVTFNRLKDFIDSLPEEPANEDLEREIQRAYYDKSLYDADNLDRQDFNNIARHFAEWQKQKDTQDFLEKAMEYFKGKPIHPFWIEQFKKLHAK